MRCSGAAKFVSGSTDGDAKRFTVAGVHRTHSGAKTALRVCGFVLRVVASTHGRAPRKGETLPIETDAHGWIVREPIDPTAKPCRQRGTTVKKAASERSQRMLLKAIPEGKQPIRLAKLRRLVRLSRPTFDAALGALHADGAVALYREDNNAALTEEDRKAAWFAGGGNPRHIVYRTAKPPSWQKQKLPRGKSRSVSWAALKKGDPAALRDFAHDVLLAARHPKTKRFGEDLAYIASVWRQWLTRSLDDVSLPSFKTALVDANRAGLLELSRADLVMAMDPDLVRQSTTHQANATFHFVRIPDSDDPSSKEATQQPVTQRILREFDRLDRESGGQNYVTMFALRSALPDVGRAAFDRAVYQLRRDWVVSLDAAEGRHKRLGREELEAGIREEGQWLTYMKRRT